MKANTDIIMILLWGGMATTVFGAEGVRVLPDSAEAIGLIGGRFTLLDDPSVVRTNPASLSKINSPALQVNFQAWEGDTDFTRLDGATGSMIENWKFLGGINYVHPINDDLTVGFGISAPFGLSMNWDSNGLFRYIAPYDALLQTAAFSPAFGYRVNDRLSIGAGLDIYYSTVTLDQAFPWAAVVGPGAVDGDMVFDGDGWGLGGFLGINYSPVDGHTFALTARLPVKVDYDGDFSITNLPAALAGTFSPTSPFDSEIEYPGSIGIGYGWEVNDSLTIGIDFEWIQNSTHDDVPLLIGANQPLLGGATGIDLDWNDSFSVGIGAEYEVSKNLTLRAGYLYSESPLKGSTYTPVVPANDRHIFSVGAGYTSGANTIDVAYAYMPMENLSVNNASQPGYNGSYEFDWHILALSYTRTF